MADEHDSRAAAEAVADPTTAGTDAADEVEILEVLDPDADDGRPLAAASAGTGADDDRDDAAEVAALRREIADLRDRSMRTLADFDNYRKRSERERREALRYAASAPLGDLLEVVDNLQRALAAGGSADDLKTGVEMTLRQLEDVLGRHGIEGVHAVGRPFDPTVHEAVSRIEDPDAETATVVEELQRGYRLHERLLRPARVVVAVPPDEA
ncbi:MAG TPA: nucleotide exchange factor GrpE [Thermoanaerobaculia bacterium]|nr:nucleotide exchange factor GrpE [Thermoanaerobaculia bacterium]